MAILCSACQRVFLVRLSSSCSCSSEVCSFSRLCLNPPTGVQATTSGCCGTCVFYALERLYALVGFDCSGEEWDKGEIFCLGRIFQNLNSVGLALAWNWEHNGNLHRLEEDYTEKGFTCTGKLVSRRYEVSVYNGNDGLKQILQNLHDKLLDYRCAIHVVQVHATLITEDTLDVKLSDLNGQVLGENVVQASPVGRTELDFFVMKLCQLRIAFDLNVYKYADFVQYYGEQYGDTVWNQAIPLTSVQMIPSNSIAEQYL